MISIQNTFRGLWSLKYIPIHSLNEHNQSLSKLDIFSVKYLLTFQIFEFWRTKKVFLPLKFKLSEFLLLKTQPLKGAQKL